MDPDVFCHWTAITDANHNKWWRHDHTVHCKFLLTKHNADTTQHFCSVPISECCLCGVKLSCCPPQLQRTETEPPTFHNREQNNQQTQSHCELFLFNSYNTRWLFAHTCVLSHCWTQEQKDEERTEFADFHVSWSLLDSICCEQCVMFIFKNWQWSKQQWVCMSGILCIFLKQPVTRQKIFRPLRIRL